MYNAVSLYICVIIKIKDTTEGELLLIGTQRTNEITKTLWKHWNSAIHKINRGRSLLCLTVNYVAFFDIMRYICYMYTNFPKPFLLQSSYRESIVKVLCILWIYRTSPYVTEVFSLLKVLLCYLCTYLFGSILNTFRILIRQSVLRKNGVHLNVIITSCTQDIDYLAHKVLVVCVRPLCYLHQSTVTCGSTTQLLLRN